VKTKAAISQDGLPKNFLNRFGEHVTGFLNGLDRVRFRATLRPLFCPNGPEVYLNYCKVLIKNFKGFAQGLSDRVKKLAYDTFQQAGRPNIYLPSSELSKEALVQDLVAKDQIKEGPIVLLSVNGNSLKMYDKEGSVLRVETTIVRPRDFRIYRPSEGQPKGQKRWRILRKGVCDMYRRGQVCRAANSVTSRPWPVSLAQARSWKKPLKSVVRLHATANAIADLTLWHRRITLCCWRSVAASSPSPAFVTLTYALCSISHSQQASQGPAAGAQPLLANLPHSVLMGF